MSQRVAVVGGGLVGTATALGLAAAGFAVSLIDRQAPTLGRGKLGLDIRNVALNPASRALLDELNVWSSEHAAAYVRMQVWEQWGSACVTFEAGDMNREELGWLVEMSPLQVRMWDAAEAHDRIDLILNTIEQIEPAPDHSGITLSFADETQLQADFVIAADGAQSVVRRSLGLPVRHHPVDQVALATVVQTELPHQSTARQRFLTDGPLALLPSPDPHLCSVVWSQSQNLVDKRLAMDDDAFCREITHASEHCLGEIQQVDHRVAFPLTQMRNLTPMWRERVLFIGDALRVVHPLAGLGVNLGFEDVRDVLKVARQSVSLTRPGAWQTYARNRSMRSAAMIRTFAAFKQIYGQADPLTTLLRNMGVRSFNAIPGIKHQVMREAMGLGPLAGGS